MPDEVAAAYSGRRLRYGPEYIIPVPFDPRLISTIPPAVAQAAVDTGVARKEMPDLTAYKVELSARLDPTVSMLQATHAEVRSNPRRVGFAEGEEETSIRAAIAFSQSGLGTPVLIGREDQIKDVIKRLGMTGAGDIEIQNAALSRGNRHYIEYLYQRLQRDGYLYRDCQRLVHQDRNVFSACMLVHGDIDAMVTGLSRSYSVSHDNIRLAIDPMPGAESIRFFDGDVGRPHGVHRRYHDQRTANRRTACPHSASMRGRGDISWSRTARRLPVPCDVR